VEGDVVVDVGCGDGLIAFGALEKVGPTAQQAPPTPYPRTLVNTTSSIETHCGERRAHQFGTVQGTTTGLAASTVAAQTAGTASAPRAG
jgi:hypothetical protein